MNELKPCPFCGGEAGILPEGDYHEVTCQQCGVFVQGHTYESAIAAWNKRAEPEPLHKSCRNCKHWLWADGLGSTESCGLPDDDCEKYDHYDSEDKCVSCGRPLKGGEPK